MRNFILCAYYSARERDGSMKNKVENVLIELGVTPNLSGFDYLCKAIEVINASDERMKLVNGVYAEVAEQLNSKVFNVERAIRLAISKMDKESEAWKNYIGLSDVTNATVIYTLALRLKED